MFNKATTFMLKYYYGYGGGFIMLLNQFYLKNLELKNRVVMPPMCMYMADDSGKANLFHEVHYLTRAVGGVGLIIQEATAILPNGRITNADLGIWSDDHIEGFSKIVAGAHEMESKIGIQLNHAGRKARVDNVVGPSAIAYEGYDVPHEMTIFEIKETVNAFLQAARRADEAGYDVLELHGAHGYLIHQFLSPLSNQRNDKYKDGKIFLKEVVDAITSVWPKEKPFGIRISATEYHPNGLNVEDWIEILKSYKDIFAFVDVSTGGNISTEIKLFPGYQLSHAALLKEKTSFTIIGGGLIEDLQFGNEVIIDDQCDLVFYGRKLLREPYFILNETAALGIDFPWPKAYVRGKK